MITFILIPSSVRTDICSDITRLKSEKADSTFHLLPYPVTSSHSEYVSEVQILAAVPRSGDPLFLGRVLLLNFEMNSIPCFLQHLKFAVEE